MTIDEIKELIHVVNQTGIAELEVQRGDDRVRIQRTHAPVAGEHVYSVPLAASVSAPAAAHIPAAPVEGRAAGTQAGALPTPETAQDTELVKSPIVGTFYESPSPGAPAFVKVGDQVSVGQVLCIIESMKLMNEIEAEIGGTIVSKLVENGRPVEYGEALFSIRPN